MAEFTLERPPTGLVRFAGASVALVRFKPGWPWEFYFVPASGTEKGRERFVRHLTAEEGARLDAALLEHEARERLERRGYSEVRPAPEPVRKYLI